MNAISSEVITRTRSGSRRAAGRELAGKTAIVTGSTSGIGLGIARALAEGGANVVLNGFGPADEIAHTKDELARTYEVKVEFNGADISKAEQVADLVRAAESALGSVDILVNNAGIQHVAPIE
ncbi:MAG TPA: SDR family NAD(P)-dependent oxidoreductase, partial [Gammaproteobacteria bacterium]|nr:SDR family NAD(P)-dependent oxidoreductase [Gammaproteobacteria bacterium]